MRNNIERAPLRAKGFAGKGYDFFRVWLARHLHRSPRPLPILVLMVTDKCNLHCRMCGACDYSPGDHDMLSLDEWKNVVDSAVRLRTQVISITGGEAMLRHDLFDLIHYIRAQGIAVHLNTNGLLLRDKNVRELKETGVETVSISVESTDPAIHDAIRGKGTLEQTIKGMRKLREAAPEIRVGLNCVMNKHNLDSLPEMVRFASREGIHQLKFAPIHTNLQHKDKPLDEYEDMVFTESDIPDLEQGVHAIRTALAETSLESCSSRFFDGIGNLYRPPASNFYCYAGYAIVTVNPQGGVAACFDKPHCANVREQPLDRIWTSPAFEKHRELVRNCDRACWDTTNAELSLRLSFRNLLREPMGTYRAVRYYLNGRRREAKARAEAQALLPLARPEKPPQC